MQVDPLLQSPPLLIAESLAGPLRALAERWLRQAPEVARRLIEEIDRAELITDGQMPDDVVTLGSSVSYRDEDSGAEHTIRLVMPTEANPSLRRVSVMTPVGAALIGLRRGQRIACEIAGREAVLAVTGVARA
ncbi:nucleoside diphosphate kinase regulator [Solimonas sp. SE-A11]|uniref:nucleoside diphosphate kinase regulator n=1 Tax=Solimonas sp. SE-A11 TaxID=3054954 RepID=UPI00259C9AF3|nr:nucleoside diphosphate kinase regulator [Solimonas sp. SE-A11]MDM4769208.1 nucleoside diphosphate kinase regulator [Solimonas sp. SE-A11]